MVRTYYGSIRMWLICVNHPPVFTLFQTLIWARTIRQFHAPIKLNTPIPLYGTLGMEKPHRMWIRVHTYENPGCYTVKISATNNCLNGKNSDSLDASICSGMGWEKVTKVDSFHILFNTQTPGGIRIMGGGNVVHSSNDNGQSWSRIQNSAKWQTSLYYRITDVEWQCRSAHNRL